MATICAVYAGFGAGGTDIRTRVLRASGYHVIECSTLPEFAGLLRSEPQVDLVCIAEGNYWPAEGALALARGLSAAPIVLFRTSEHHYIQRIWDLEVPAFARPETWLKELAELIERTCFALRGTWPGEGAAMARTRGAKLRDQIREHSKSSKTF